MIFKCRLIKWIINMDVYSEIRLTGKRFRKNIGQHEIIKRSRKSMYYVFTYISLLGMNKILKSTAGSARIKSLKSKENETMRFIYAIYLASLTGWI